MMRVVAIGVLVAMFPACGVQSVNCSLLLQNVDALTVSVVLRPFGSSREGDPQGGLRSVLLHRGICLEPHAQWSRDGGFISSDAKLGRAAMIAVVEDLDGLAIWEHAERYYAPVREEPRLAPPEGREFVPQQNDGSFCKVRADYTSGDYCSIFIVWVPWGEETQKLLLRLRKHIPASIADELLKTFERFRDRA